MKGNPHFTNVEAHMNNNRGAEVEGMVKLDDSGINYFKVLGKGADILFAAQTRAEEEELSMTNAGAITKAEDNKLPTPTLEQKVEPTVMKKVHMKK